MAKRISRKRSLQCYLLLSPSLIGMALFVVFPIIWVFRYCLYRYTGFGDPIYIGFENFVRVFTRDPKFWKSVVNSFIFAFGKLLIELPMALIIAYLIAERFRGSTFYRTIFYMPSILSVAIVGLQFGYLFASYSGVVNEWLLSLGVTQFFGQSIPRSWFSSRASSLIILMLASLWQNFGVNMLFFMTGLQSIPTDIYEAAEIDGTNKTQRFFRVTLPMLGPVAQIVVMNAILASLKMAALVLVLTNGQPGGDSEVMMTYIYKLFFGATSGQGSNYGYASTLVILASIMLAIVAVIYLRTTRKSSNIYTDK